MAFLNAFNIFSYISDDFRASSHGRYSLRESVLCWTSQGQLWNVDLAAEAAAPEHQEEVLEKPTSLGPIGDRSGLLEVP